MTALPQILVYLLGAILIAVGLSACVTAMSAPPDVRKRALASAQALAVMCIAVAVGLAGWFHQSNQRALDSAPPYGATEY